LFWRHRIKGPNDKSGAGIQGFLKSLTRNFTFSAYVRAGVQFNGSGGGGNFNFEPPDNAGAERPRLGNENDTYMELTWIPVAFTSIAWIFD
jgi:maltoporin